MECSVTRRFARIWRIDFEVETRNNLDDELLVEREGRGTAYLALAAGREAEQSYDEYLRRALAELGAAAFDEPYAGLRPDRPPFGGPVAIRSVEPSWSCFTDGSARSATQYSRDLTVAPDGTEQVSGSSSSGYGGEEITESLCSALDDATVNAYPEAIRTMSTPRVLVEEVLRVEVSDLLHDEAYADELVELPDGASLSRKKTPGVRRSEGVSSHNMIVESRLTVEEVEISARIMPAEVPVAAGRANVWHSRWTLETVERRLGPLPEARVIDTWSLTASLMPTLPPRDLDRGDDGENQRFDPDSRYPVRFDQTELFTSVGESLDFRAEMSPNVLADAIVRKIEGLETSGWVLVLCRTDAEATWGLAPTTGRSSLLNGDAYCGTVETHLP